MEKKNRKEFYAITQEENFSGDLEELIDKMLGEKYVKKSIK